MPPLTSRLLYVSSNHRMSWLSEKYNLSPQTIRRGDFLFRLEQLNQDGLSDLQKVVQDCNPFLKILVKEKNAVLLKVIPEPELFTVLNDFSFSKSAIKAFFAQIAGFFNGNQKIKWILNSNVINFNDCPQIMGIVNVTPDSFSDGGRFFDTDRAVDHALEMIEQGADIIDVGGESTRPGSQKVALKEELQRVIPVIEEIRRHSDVPISIDTYKSVVADEAIRSGADIINDISGMTFNEDMLAVIAKYRCPYVIMHIQGNPQNMQQDPSYDDVQTDVYNYLSKKCEVIAPHNDGKVIIDPGFGFGKSINHNLLLLRDLLDFTFIGKPVLIGVSRKSFIGKILDADVEQRSVGTIAAELYASLMQAAILRVHDVGQANQAKKMLKHIVAA